MNQLKEFLPQSESFIFQSKTNQQKPQIIRCSDFHNNLPQFVCLNPIISGKNKRTSQNIKYRIAYTIESDMMTLSTQEQFFKHVLGDKFTMQVFSGNKSWHYHIILDVPINEQQDKELTELLKTAFPFCDNAVISNRACLVRTPDAMRDNGKKQELKYTGKIIKYNELLAHLKSLVQGKKTPKIISTKDGKITKDMMINNIIELTKCGYDIDKGLMQTSLQDICKKNDLSLNDCISEAKTKYPQNDDSLFDNTNKTRAATFDGTKTRSATFDNNSYQPWLDGKLSTIDMIELVQKYGKSNSQIKDGNNGTEYVLRCQNKSHDDEKPSAFITRNQNGVQILNCSSCNTHINALQFLTDCANFSHSEAHKMLTGFTYKPECNRCGNPILFKKNKPYSLDETPHKCKRKKEKTTSDSIKEDDKKLSSVDKKAGECFIDGKFIPSLAREIFLKSLDFSMIHTDDYFWAYKNGCWQQLHDKDVKSLIDNFLGRFTVTRYVNEIFNLCENFLRTNVSFNDNWDKINLKNGVFCLTQRRLLPHNKEYYFNYQIPHNYKEKAEKPKRWLQFLDEIRFTEDQKIRIQEWFGFSMTSHYEITRRMEKCLYLIGDGENGKGVMLDTLAHMLGKKNTVSVEPSEITSRFGAISLYGKLANIGTDIKSVVALEESFKKIVSGETVTTDRKHKEMLTFRPFTKQIFSSNGWLPTKDRSHGFFRRFDIFQFTRQFSKNEIDKGLKFKLERETEQILMWAIDGLKRLIENEYKFSDSIQLDIALEGFKDRSNHVKMFLREFDFDGQILASDLRENYNDWCKLNGYSPLAQNRFGEELAQLGVKHIRKRDHLGKKPYYYVIDELINPQEDDPQEDQEPETTYNNGWNNYPTRITSTLTEKDKKQMLFEMEQKNHYEID